MAILNLTPDSFYEPSRTPPVALLERAEAALAAGADILDLGAESTRPGATPVPPDIEQARLLPALAALRAHFPQALLSADTRHASTARLALERGADIINDVTGLHDPALGESVAAAGAGAILMHRRGEFATMQHLPPLADPVAHVADGLAAIAARATASGLAPAQVVLDPGFGFGKNLDQNIPLLARFDQFHALGFPLLAGVSRKSFLGGTPEQRLVPSLAAAVAAVLAGAHIVRVHDVAPTVAAVAFADRLLAEPSQL